MKFSAIISLIAIAASTVSAVPSLQRREVPQEHSHDLIVNAVRNIVREGNNQNAFVGVDPIFALLGDGAANTGIAQDAKLTNAAQKNPDCLQQNIADECISNAKKVGNSNLGAVNTKVATCLQFRALEKNTIGIGLNSKQCTAAPRNAELAGLKQHQDPAANGATAENKAIEIELGKKIFALGGFSADAAANLALQTATFAPGDKGDNTFKGNTCDDLNVVAKANGEFFGRRIAAGQVSDCIAEATIARGRSQAVPAASKNEIVAALGGAAAGGAAAGQNNNQGQGNNNQGQGNNNNQGQGQNNNQGQGQNNNQGQGNNNNNQGQAGKAQQIAQASQLLQQALALLNSI
ncbi:hypothetical protein BC829DRAFT_399355 [Chytridium lagenaria]|nr:hypothetical protein BC829DRAFT_399355 [Chytridium lagenaria]